MLFPIAGNAGIEIAPLTVSEMIGEIVEAIEQGRGIGVSYLNFHTANLIASQPTLTRTFERIDMVTTEGVAVIRALQLLGYPAGRENSLSAEFWGPPLFREAVRRGWAVFLFGGQPGVAERAALNLQDAYPGLRIAGTRHGHLASPLDEQQVVDELRRTGSAIVLVGRGQPRQEEWIVANRSALGPAAVIGVGSYFDKASRLAEGYPPWVYRHRLFWLYRLCTQPRALWRRYLLGGPSFFLRVLHARVRG